MGVRRMYARRKEPNQRRAPCFGERVVRPQPVALAEIGQDRGVLRKRCAVIQSKQRHPALRVELEIGLGPLFALGEIDPERLVVFAALFQDDMRGHGARARSEIKAQHGNHDHPAQLDPSHPQEPHGIRPSRGWRKQGGARTCRKFPRAPRTWSHLGGVIERAPGRCAIACTPGRPDVDQRSPRWRAAAPWTQRQGRERRVPPPNCRNGDWPSDWLRA